MTSIAKEIELELRRLEAGGSSGWSVYHAADHADLGLPTDWVTLCDYSGESVYGPADLVLSALKETRPDLSRVVDSRQNPSSGEWEQTMQTGYHAACESLGQFGSRMPEGVACAK